MERGQKTGVTEGVLGIGWDGVGDGGRWSTFVNLKEKEKDLKNVTYKILYGCGAFIFFENMMTRHSEDIYLGF